MMHKKYSVKTKAVEQQCDPMFLNILGDSISRKYNSTVNADYFWRAGIIRDFLLYTYTMSMFIIINFFTVSKCIALIILFFFFLIVGCAVRFAGS